VRIRRGDETRPTSRSYGLNRQAAKSLRSRCVHGAASAPPACARRPPLSLCAGNSLGAAGVCSMTSALVPTTVLTSLDLSSTNMQVKAWIETDEFTFVALDLSSTSTQANKLWISGHEIRLNQASSQWNIPCESGGCRYRFPHQGGRRPMQQQRECATRVNRPWATSSAVGTPSLPSLWHLRSIHA
jgi:hypothetical protein